MKKIFIFATSLIMVVVLCFSVIGCSVQTATSTVTDFESTSLNEVVIETTDDHYVENSSRHETIKREMKLMANGAMSYGLNYSAQTLIATVTPASATVKDVIWTIAWASESQTNPLENYFAVIPSYEGSNVAEVRCYREPTFSDSEAIVTATTADGGFIATCRVIFRGKPSNINVVGQGLRQDVDGNYLLDSEGYHSYKFDIELTNVHNYVDPEYKKSTVEILSLTGSVVVADAYTGGDGDIYYYSGTEKTIRFTNLLHCFDVSVSNTDSTLIIKYDFSDMSESSTPGSSDETYYTNHFVSLIETEEYIMTLKVTNNTGLSETITIKFQIPVTGITVNKDIIYF